MTTIRVSIQARLWDVTVEAERITRAEPVDGLCTCPGECTETAEAFDAALSADERALVLRLAATADDRAQERRDETRRIARSEMSDDSFWRWFEEGGEQLPAGVA